MKHMLIVLFSATIVCMLCMGCTGGASGMFGAPTINITIEQGNNADTCKDNNSTNTVGDGAIQIDLDDGGFGEGASVANRPLDKSKEDVAKEDTSENASDDTK